MQIVRMLKLAKSACRKSDHPEHKMSAVLFKNKGAPISIGVNSTKTHPIIKKHSLWGNLAIHAEIHALLKCKDKEDAIGASILVFREGPSGLLNAKPCLMCRKILKDYGVRKVFYTCDNHIKEEDV